MTDQELLMNPEKDSPTPRADALAAHFPESQYLTADGYDSAILGVDDTTDRVIYSVRGVLQILQAQGMDEEEALEFFNFNVEGSYVGEKTPIWCHDEYLEGVEGA